MFKNLLESPIYGMLSAKFCFSWNMLFIVPTFDESDGTFVLWVVFSLAIIDGVLKNTWKSIALLSFFLQLF